MVVRYMPEEKKIPEKIIKKSLDKQQLPRTGEQRNKHNDYSYGSTEYMQQNPHRDADDKKKK